MAAAAIVAVNAGGAGMTSTSSLVGSFGSLNSSDIAARRASKARSNKNFSKESYEAAAACPAVLLINSGRFDDVTLSDIEDLFVALDDNHNGLLDFNEITCLLKEVLDPPCTADEIEVLYQLTDKRDDGNVTPKELHFALTAGPVKQHLKQLQAQDRIKQRFNEEMGYNIHVERDLMIDKLAWRVERDDAFITLPFSMGYLFVFVSLVIIHLKTFERGQVERGMKEWIHGYGGNSYNTGPYLVESVSNFGSAWDWLDQSGLPLVFGECVGLSAAEMECPLASRHVLVGDVGIRLVSHGGSEQTVYLLRSEIAKEYLSNNPGDYLGAARAEISRMRNAPWIKFDKCRDLQFRFLTFNNAMKMATHTVIQITFTKAGIIMPSVSVGVADLDAYGESMWIPALAAYAADVIYLLFLVIPFYKEMKDLTKSILHTGFYDGVMHSMHIWNIVDWISIIVGVVTVSMWSGVLQAQNSESLKLMWTSQSLVDIDHEELKLVESDILAIVSLYQAMKYTTAVNACSIMLKFFKAFQANRRLQLVTQTIVRATNDILHFSVVFSAIFVGYAAFGHILFGTQHVEFGSFSSSCNTAFYVLMGDFGWYVDNMEADSSDEAKIVYILWFWSFNVIVLLILLNMLLAIILEHYVELWNELKADGHAIPSLVQQARAYVREHQATKSHIPLSELLLNLEDDDADKHPEHTVTVESLKRAFPEMKDEQANWLLEWLMHEAQAQSSMESEDHTTARLRKIEDFMDVIAADLHVVKLNVAVCTSRVRDGVRMGGVAAQPQPITDRSRPDPVASRSAANYGDHVSEQLGKQLATTTRELARVSAELAATSSELASSSIRIDGVARAPALQGLSTRSPPTVREGNLREVPACGPFMLGEAAFGTNPDANSRGPLEFRMDRHAAYQHAGLPSN